MTNHSTTMPADHLHEEAQQAEDEISLLDLAIVIAKHKKLILGLPTFAAVAAIAVALLLPNIYTGTTKVLPPQSGGGAAAMLAQLGGLAGMAGGMAGVKNPNDTYIAMLKSRTVADSMLQRFDLQKYYEAKLASDARKSLEGNTRITAGKDGVISIEVDDEDPKRAADMANAYVDELFKLTKVLAVTEASQRRLFFERQFVQARDNLAKAEIAARQALATGGLTNIEAQGRTLIETTARLRGQISVKEVQIGSLRGFAAERNPALLQAQQELAVLKQELAKLEGANTADRKASEEGSGFENLRLLRDVKYYETVYAMLAQQVGLAKIEEAKDSSVVQVLDKAIEPDRKSKPKRALIVLIATLAAGFLGILLAFVREALNKARQNPETASRFQELWRYLGKTA